MIKTLKSLKRYIAMDSFHHSVVVIAFDAVTALYEAKKALYNDIISLTLSE